MSTIKRPIRKKLKHTQFLKERKGLGTAESDSESQESIPHPRMRNHCNNTVFLLDGSMNMLALQAPLQRQGSILSHWFPVFPLTVPLWDSDLECSQTTAIKMYFKEIKIHSTIISKRVLKQFKIMDSLAWN